MRGSNKLTLNHECLVEAVQLWLDVQYKKNQSPTVERVEEADHEEGQPRSFEVELSGPQPRTAAAALRNHDSAPAPTAASSSRGRAYVGPADGGIEWRPVATFDSSVQVADSNLRDVEFVPGPPNRRTPTP